MKKKKVLDTFKKIIIKIKHIYTKVKVVKKLN